MIPGPWFFEKVDFGSSWLVIHYIGYRVKREGNGFRVLHMGCLASATGSMNISIRCGL